MRIGIDGTALVGNRAGVGRYVYELCRALDRQLPNANFYVYSHVPIKLPVESQRWHARFESNTWMTKLKGILWLKTRAGAFCKADELDAFWASGTFLPKLNPNVVSVTTVYDLNVRLVPSTMKLAPLVLYKMFFERDVRRADKLVAISNGTANRLKELFGLDADGIVLPSVTSSFKPPDPEFMVATLERLGVHRPYLLAVGTLEPRKNLSMLIDVFAKLQSAGECPEYKLILVGGKGWKNKLLKRLMRQNENAGVLPLGYVSDEDLPSLYAGSGGFIFPSVYEGFGMPVAEARACGARVIATDIPEIREAGGIGPHYIAPTADALLAAMRELLAQTSASECPAQVAPSWNDGAKILGNLLTGGVK